METYTLNNELIFNVPDGFHQMSEEERRGMNFIKEGEGECFSDPQRHMVFSAAWKKAGFAAMLVNAEEACESMEKQVAKPMASFGYACEGFFARDLDGEEAHGFNYGYETQGTGMSGCSLIVKKGKTFYYLHFYMRTALKEESSAVVSEILDSVKWN